MIFEKKENYLFDKRGTNFNRVQKEINLLRLLQMYIYISNFPKLEINHFIYIYMERSFY